MQELVRPTGKEAPRHLLAVAHLARIIVCSDLLAVVRIPSRVPTSTLESETSDALRGAHYRGLRWFRNQDGDPSLPTPQPR